MITTTKKPRAKTYTAGARTIVDRIITKLNRDWKETKIPAVAIYIDNLIFWIEKADERYNAKAGGLGRAKKSVR